MTESNFQIKDVSDTSIWVAYYRAQETRREDALFSDPFAERLIGSRGKEIADQMKTIGRYTEWTVIIRTVIIDEFIQSMIQQGVDTIINLGAGLDTRPYRLSLPKELNWFEIDFSTIIDHKTKILKDELPHCKLNRIRLDLTSQDERKRLFKKIGEESKKALVITEGVLPYLSERDVALLAKDLHEESSFCYWIGEFLDPAVYKYLKNGLRSQQLKNAPFLFFPNHWLKFFEQQGWGPKAISYLGEVGAKHNRDFPLPGWASFLKIFFPKLIFEKTKKMTGFILFEKIQPQFRA